MKLSQIFRVRVVENPKIKFEENGTLKFIPSNGSKSYETYMIHQHGNTYRDFNNNFYTYCKTVKDYIQKDNFQNEKIILDFVSNISIADEFVLDGTTDIDYSIIKKLISLYEINFIDNESFKNKLEEALKEAKSKQCNDKTSSL